MPDRSRIAAILRADSVRWHILGIVADLDLPDCWIAAGFVRNAVWDMLHGRPKQQLMGDVDVIWFDSACLTTEPDREIEATLRKAEPSVTWSVKNQARMHLRNNDAPYQSSSHAMQHWPETATSVAARRAAGDQCEVAAPLGLSDLLSLVLMPTPHFAAERRSIFDARCKRPVIPALQGA